MLTLAERGWGKRRIARELGVSRNTVKKILASGHVEVPTVERDESLGPHLDRVRALHRECRGNLIRVWEELEARHEVAVPYSTLTGFCRRHEIGVKPKERSGSYHFAPGEEMQHDTSPHDVTVGGRERRLQCASVVLCYSHVRFAQCYPRFNRFICKVFLTDAIQYFGGAASRGMIDNTRVIVLEGTGRDAVIHPEMEAFAKRIGFKFVAHELGDANRSARVEAPFWHIENNFYPGRTFADLADLNVQLLAWCERYNAKWNKAYKASPRELFVAELDKLQPLPEYVPEVYKLHGRLVDTDGNVNLHTNRYPMPCGVEGKVTVHETRDQIKVFDGHRLVIEYPKEAFGAGVRVPIPEHLRQRRRGMHKRPPLPEETTLRSIAPEFGALVDALRKRHGGRAVRTVRQLHRMYTEYPTDVLVHAVQRALEFGLIDLRRIERMVLRDFGENFFQLPTPDDDEEDQDG